MKKNIFFQHQDTIGFRSTRLPKSRFHSVFNRGKRFFVTHTAQIPQIGQKRDTLSIAGGTWRKRISDLRRQFQGSKDRIHHRQIGSFESASEVIHAVGRTMLHKPIKNSNRILHIQIVPQGTGIFRFLFRLWKYRFPCCLYLPIICIYTGGLLSYHFLLPSINFAHSEDIPERRLPILPSRPHDKTIRVEIRVWQLHGLVKSIQ